MKLEKCRICEKRFFHKPLLRLKGMPKAAQYLPKKNELKKDKGITLELYQCSGCGLIQLNCKPVPYNKEVIRASGFSKELGNFKRKQFEIFIEKYSLKRKKIIEIGCGRGEYLSILKSCGVDVYGIEYSLDAVKECRKKGLKVNRYFIESEESKIKNGPFDAFCMFNFLEHLPRPNIVLRGIYNNLKDKAVGLVEVPNFDMIFQKNLFAEFIRDHLFYFTQKTLKTALEINGFEVIEVNEVWHKYTLSAVIRKKEKLNFSGFVKYHQTLKEQISKYFKNYKKIAVWGAGHQALSLISLLRLKNKIKYVIDSAFFKQNKFTPASHIPIVSPEILKVSPIEAVIVIAGSYSSEVVQILKENFKKNIDIFVICEEGLNKIRS